MRISDWSSDVCSSDLPAAGHFDEAVLNLRRAPLLLHAVSRHRHQSVGADDRPRRVGIDGQVLAEDHSLVDGDQHAVVVARALSRQRHLALKLDVTAVGEPSDGVVGLALLGTYPGPYIFYNAME